MSGQEREASQPDAERRGDHVVRPDPPADPAQDQPGGEIRFPVPEPPQDRRLRVPRLQQLGVPLREGDGGQELCYG